MAEYIDRAVCLSILRAKANMAVLMDASPYFEKATQMLEKLPAADVAPVVRCKDCKHYLIADEFEGGKRYMCEVNHISYINSDGDMRYCSYGERKDKADAKG